MSKTFVCVACLSLAFAGCEKRVESAPKLAETATAVVTPVDLGVCRKLAEKAVADALAKGLQPFLQPIPPAIVVSIAGITNGTCSDCGAWNGTFTLGFVDMMGDPFRPGQYPRWGTTVRFDGKSYRLWAQFSEPYGPLNSTLSVHSEYGEIGYGVSQPFTFFWEDKGIAFAANGAFSTISTQGVLTGMGGKCNAPAATARASVHTP